MGQKINPHGFRQHHHRLEVALACRRACRVRWRRRRSAGLPSSGLERAQDADEDRATRDRVRGFTARPRNVIGRRGIEADRFADLEKRPAQVQLNILEVKTGVASAIIGKPSS